MGYLCSMWCYFPTGATCSVLDLRVEAPTEHPQAVSKLCGHLRHGFPRLVGGDLCAFRMVLAGTHDVPHAWLLGCAGLCEPLVRTLHLEAPCLRRSDCFGRKENQARISTKEKPPSSAVARHFRGARLIDTRQCWLRINEQEYEIDKKTKEPFGFDKILFFVGLWCYYRSLLFTDAAFPSLLWLRFVDDAFHDNMWRVEELRDQR